MKKTLYRHFLLLTVSIVFMSVQLLAQDTIVIEDQSYGGYELDAFEAIGEFSNGDFILAGETWNYGSECCNSLSINQRICNIQVTLKSKHKAFKQ
jgi:hypothetical protein